MSRVFVVAEIGVNHNGSREMAFALIDAAKEAGADAVKFQTFHADELASPRAEMAAYQVANTGTRKSQLDMLRRLQFSADDFLALRRYADEKGIRFFSTPFDFASVDLLEALEVQMYKIGSGDLTNLPLLRYVAAKGKPILLSTGMATLGEVEEALQAVEGKAPVTLLHSTTNYPTEPHEVNLRAMVTLHQAFGVPVGYSDHTAGWEVAVAAVALGATIIEKHLTLSKDLPGPDHRASLEPDEFRQMVHAIRTVEQALGDGRKRPTPAEEAIKRQVRKSLVARRDLPAGHVITEEDVAIKRPEVGILPKDLDLVIGRRLRQLVRKDQFLYWTDLE